MWIETLGSIGLSHDDSTSSSRPTRCTSAPAASSCSRARSKRPPYQSSIPKPAVLNGFQNVAVTGQDLPQHRQHLVRALELAAPDEVPPDDDQRAEHLLVGGVEAREVEAAAVVDRRGRARVPLHRRRRGTRGATGARPRAGAAAARRAALRCSRSPAPRWAAPRRAPRAGGPRPRSARTRPRRRPACPRARSGWRPGPSRRRPGPRPCARARRRRERAAGAAGTVAGSRTRRRAGARGGSGSGSRCPARGRAPGAASRWPAPARPAAPPAPPRAAGGRHRARWSRPRRRPARRPAWLYRNATRSS